MFLTSSNRKIYSCVTREVISEEGWERLYNKHISPFGGYVLTLLRH